jgi:hypothetical protein
MSQIWPPTAGSCRLTIARTKILEVNKPGNQQEIRDPKDSTREVPIGVTMQSFAGSRKHLALTY